MTEETKRKVRDALRAPGNRGSIVELARRANCTTQWVNRVLSGNEEDDDLVVLASELVKELADKKAAKERQVLTNLQQASSFQNLELA